MRPKEHPKTDIGSCFVEEFCRNSLRYQLKDCRQSDAIGKSSQDRTCNHHPRVKGKEQVDDLADPKSDTCDQ